MPTDELRDRIAAELHKHFAVNSAPGIVFCRCGVEVRADRNRLGMREHLADMVLAVVQTASEECPR